MSLPRLLEEGRVEVRLVSGCTQVLRLEEIDALMDHLQVARGLVSTEIAMTARQPGMQTIRDLAMLVKLLARDNANLVAYHSKGGTMSKRANDAMDYLQRKGLQGSPLRAAVGRGLSDGSVRQLLVGEIVEEGDLILHNGDWIPLRDGFGQEYHPSLHSPIGRAVHDQHEGMKTALGEAISEALVGAWDCGRVWEAWEVGTMSEEDFTPTAEDPARVEELVDAVLEVMQPVIDAADLADPRTLMDEQERNEHLLLRLESAERELQDHADVARLQGRIEGRCDGVKQAIKAVARLWPDTPEAQKYAKPFTEAIEVCCADMIYYQPTFPSWRKEVPDTGGAWWYWNGDPEDRPTRVDVVMRSCCGKMRDYIYNGFSGWATNIKGGMWLREIEPKVPGGSSHVHATF